MRYGFFMAAAAWGFVLGAGFLAVALGLEGAPLPRNGATAGLMVLGIALALIGGLLGAKSYRESRSR